MMLNFILLTFHALFEDHASPEDKKKGFLGTIFILKELVYKPLPANLPALKEKVRLAFSDLPESMVARAVL